MLKSLRIKNFQSHKRTVLNFHPQVNCIVGSSDVGKTAIIRALRWLVWNRPSGNDFRSTWGGVTQVTANVDGHEVTRLKGRENAYVLDGSHYTAMNRDVPAEVAKLLNVNEINLQNQFDRPFLLDESPGEVARFFNTVAHLDIIDSTLKNLQSWLRAVQRSIESDREQLTELNTQLKEYDGLDALDAKVLHLEELSDKLDDATANVEELTDLIEQVEETENAVATAEEEARLGPAVDKVVGFITVCQQTQERSANLGQAVNEALALNSHLGLLARVISLEKPVTAALGLITKRDAAATSLTEFSTLLEKIITAHDRLTTAEANLDNLKQRFLDEFPNVCPLCGTEYDIRRKDDLLLSKL